MTETAVIPAEERDRNAELAAQVVVKGDLSKLTEPEKMAYYTALCRSLGLNPLTRPFEFITLNGKLTLYAKRDAADQIRNNAGVTVTKIDKDLIGDIYVVTAYGRTPGGREDASTGAVTVKGLAGEALANAYMKAETKAKRRLTLSLVGLGFPTEDEVEDIPEPPAADPPKTLAERIAQRAAAIAADPEPVAAETSTGEIEGTFVEAPADEPPPMTTADTAPVGLTRDQLKDLCVRGGKSSAAISRVLGCDVDQVGAKVAAMTDAERGVLADELNLDWRGGAA